VCGLVFSPHIASQVLVFDRLEQLYDQGHYRMVYRKSKRLLNNPEYDYSLLPQYYFSLTTLQQIPRAGFRKRHEQQIIESFEFLSQLRKSNKGQEVFRTHANEVEGLQLDLYAWAQSEKEIGDKDFVERFKSKIASLYTPVKQPEGGKVSANWVASNSEALKVQESMIAFAEKLTGTPYLWGGMSTDGFDCSGFTSYVFKEFGVELPRVSRDQYDKCTKIEASEARIGDLVFFGKDGNVSHVGILVNQQGEPKKMIHASSSKGIMFQSIADSKYYTSRLIGYGRY
jgi:cell wall-associated NlpC family hydrolase